MEAVGHDVTDRPPQVGMVGVERAQSRELAGLPLALGLGYGRGDEAVDGLHVVGGRGYRLDHVAVATRSLTDGQQVGNSSLPVGVGIVEMIGGLHRTRRDLFGIHVTMGVDDGVLVDHDCYFGDIFRFWFIETFFSPLVDCHPERRAQPEVEGSHVGKEDPSTPPQAAPLRMTAL